MKRTRRIEIVRYSRRIAMISDDAEIDSGATAEYAASMGIPIPAPLDGPPMLEQTDNPVDCAPQRRRWFRLDWLKRE